MKARRMVFALFVLASFLVPARALLALPLRNVADEQQPQSQPASRPTEKNVGAGENSTSDEQKREADRNAERAEARKKACDKEKETGVKQFDAQGLETCPGPKSVLEFALGYTVVRSNDTEPANADALPVGWSVGFAAKLARSFAVVSELSAAYDSDGAVPPATHRTAVYFLNGVRVMGPIGRVTFFGEGLAGVAHDRDFRPLQTSKNRFVVRPGAGVDFRLSTNVSYRFQAGWTLDFEGTKSPEVLQLATGLVFGR